jgi:aminoglycoside phosphotransferase (APT) family kinase protein
MLEHAGIADYLLSLGLVKPAAVVEDDLVVVDASRRNSVFIATGRTGPAHVVKQADARTAATLAHEAAVLRTLAAMPELAGLVPEVVHHDADARRLVLRTAAGGRDWARHHGDRRFPLAPARALGRALAALHRLPGDALIDLPPGVDRMWGLTLPQPSHEMVLDLSAAAIDLVARVQASDDVCARLQELRATVPGGAIVHGDLRWENCVLVAAPGGRRRTRVLLVDWELAGRGPAAFDVGTALAEYLIRWVGSIPILDARDPSRFVDRARHPLERMRPAVIAFWQAYCAAIGRPPALKPVVELAAVRLLQASVESAMQSAAPSAHGVVLAQLAANLLDDPDAAALVLLGLSA